MKLDNKHIYFPKYNVKKFITVETNNASLVLVVNEDKSLLTCHFGAKIDNLEHFAANGFNAKGEELPKTISSFAGCEHNSTLRVTHNDLTISTELIYQSHYVHSIDENISETIIVLRDKIYDFYLELHYLAYAEEDIFECWNVINNNEPGKITLHDYASFELPLTNQNADYYLTSLYGLWEREAKIQQEKLYFGKKTLENRYGTWSSFGFNPSFILSIEGQSDEDKGEVISGAYAWTGNWRMDFNYDFSKLNHDKVERQLLTISASTSTVASDYNLEPGEAFITPKFVLNYSVAGTGQISRNYHRWSRRYNLRDGNNPRPIILNSWEGAYFDFNEDTLIKMMDDSVEMGVEMFVLDDGWFGEGKYARNNINSGLGDWKVNSEKLPRGLNFLIEQANKRGLAFGIWVEPEMVSPNSELFHKHPQWAIHQENRTNILYRQQLVLDLSNPDVQEYIFQSVANILTEYPKISYIKWDCNRSITNLGSGYLSKEKQSHLWHDYVNGLYSVYGRIARAYPDVILQLCASGGGRIDYGALKYHHEFWPSDNTDALQRIYIQWGLSHIYPAIACANHVSMCPNHQTGRTLPLKFRMDVAMSGRLGLDLNIEKISEEELKFVQGAVETYQEIKFIIATGDLYRILSPYQSDFSVISYLSEDESMLVLFAYKLSHFLGQLMPVIKLKGLAADGDYLLEELNLHEGQPAHCQQNGITMTGNDLMIKGIRINLFKEYDSAIYIFKKIT